MDEQTLMLLTSFGLKVLSQFKHRNDEVGEDEILVLAKSHYDEALSTNQDLQIETKNG